MNNLRGSKRPIESILVAKGNQALVAGTTALSAANGDVNIADGQLFVGNAQTNVAISAGNTPANASQIKIYQGTNTSADIAGSQAYPGAKRPYEASGIILGNNVTVYTGKAFENPVRSAWTVGAASGVGVGEIIAADETEYALNIALRGRRVDEFHSSVHGVPVQPFVYTTPDYTTLTAIADNEDHLIQNLAYKVNRNSRQFSFDSPSYGASWPVIALAIKSNGSASATLTCTSAVATDAVTVNGLVYTGVAGVKANNTQFSIDTSDTACALDLADSIANDTRTGVTVSSAVIYATSALGVVTIVSNGVSANAVDVSSADATIVASVALLTGGTGVGLDSLVGTTVPVMATSAGNKSIKIDADYFATFAALIASGDVPATATVELIDVATAGVNTCDQIVLVALDELLAFEDRNKSTKIRLAVGATKGFEDSLVVASKSVDPYEGEGTYRQWKLFYDNTAGQRKYSQYRGFETQNIVYPDSLVAGESYNAYIIEHFSSNHTDFTGISNSPLKTIILVPTADAATKASLEAVLNPYLAPLTAVSL